MGAFKQEDQEKNARAKIAAYKEVAGYCETVCDVVKQFDGKVFNCRLQNALQAAGVRAWIEKRYKYLEISCFVKGISGDFTLAQIKLEDMPDGKRIPADLIIASAKSRRDIHLDRAAGLETMINEAPFIRLQLDQLKSQIDEIVSGIPGEAADIFNLYYRVSTR